MNLSLARTSAAGSGDLDITITATNGNAPPVSATVIVHRTGLVAQGLYVTQGIQLDTGFLTPSGTGQSGGSYLGVSLVAGKATVVRLYADAPANPEGVAGTSALLYGYSQDGSPLPGSPLEPDYGPTTLPDTNPYFNSNYSDVVLDSELESDANAYTFTLPYGWVGGSLYYGPKYPASPGPITLSGRILPPYASSGTESASCVASNTFTLTNVTFTEVGHGYGAEIVPVAMTVNGAQPPPPAQVFADASAATPLPDGSVGGAIPYFATGDITDIANSNQSASQKNAAVLGRLESYDIGACCEVVGVTLGTAYGDTNTVPTNGKRPGGGLFSSGTATYSVVNGSPGGRPLTSVAHELFHQFGLVHASNECGGGQDGDADDIGQTGEPWQPLAPAPGEPTENPPNDGIGQLDGIGLNITFGPYQVIANRSPSFPSNPQAYDLMSYCANVGGGDPNDWVSPRNWQQLISNFGTGAAADVATAASAARGAAAARGPLAATARVDPARLSVLGFVTNQGVYITNVGPQVGPAPPNGTSVDSFTLTARGSHGQVLASVPMAATTGGHIDEVSPLVQITGDVSASGVDSIQIANSGTVIATRDRPAKTPRVKVLSPRAGARVGARRTVLVQWKATNPEHLALTAMVDYSRNGGRTWRTVFVGPNRGRVSLESFFFTASRNARVRVRVNDGFNETNVVSGVFTALGAPPQVTILTRLARGTRFPGDARLQLTGQAVDQAAQLLSAGRLRWFDGPFLLGTGAAISAGPLPAGVNHIRLVARDPAGRTASATLTVTVNHVNLPFLKLTIPNHVSRGAGKLTLRGAASIPATLTIGRRSFRLGTKSTDFSLPISRGKAPLLLHLSVTADGITTPFAALIARR